MPGGLAPQRHWEKRPTSAGRVRRRRFFAPWTVEETDACSVVRDRGGQALALFARRGYP